MLVLRAALIAMLSGAAAAHHAPTIYDLTHPVVVSGIVVSFEWEQPHTWTTVECKDAAGQPETWRLEGMNPSYLGRRGWTRYTLEPGSAIEVRFYPRRDGTREGLFLEARLADGTVKLMAIEPAQSGR